MAILKGYNKVFGICEEASYGTKTVAGMVYGEFDEESLAKEVTPILSSGIRGKGYHTRKQQGTIDVGGSITGNVFSEGAFPLILKGVSGSVSSAQQGGTTAYQHTISLADDIIYGDTKGLTVTIDRDVRSLDFYGMVINQLTLKSANNQNVKWTAEFIGQNQETGSTPTPTYTTAAPFLHTDAVVTIGGTTINVSDWSIIINNNYMDNYYGGGSTRIKVPRNGRRDITGSITFPVIEDFDIYDAFIANSSAIFAVTITGVVISGIYYHKLYIYMPIIRYDGPSSPGSGGVEVPSMEVPFRAYGDASSAEITSMYIVSTETSI